MSKFQPVKERLTTIGEGGKRFWLYPASFHGLWLKRRRLLAYVLVLIFFFVPWTKIGGHQTVLLDVAERKFAIFGVVFWPQDTLIFWFFLLGTVIGIFLITALWGRLWCGWACPQTVFLEHIFRRIETWIEGDAQKRRILDAAPWSFKKMGKKLAKHALFLAVSSHFANTLLCYFAGTEHVLRMTFHSPDQNWGWFTFMAFFNFLFYLNFAWFREQFCLIACPYGRFQSALLDADSLIVAYNPKRGEPRAVLRKQENRESKGDCIDCNRCVAVCPTGIDIRMGLQMECVNCTACMDACDEVMEKTHQPKKLIGYTSIAELEGRKRKILRPRVIAYALLVLVLWSGGIYWLMNKRNLRMQFLRPKGASFTIDEKANVITNLFHAKAINRTTHDFDLKLVTSGDYDLVTAFNPWHIPAQQTMENQVFIRRMKAGFSKTGKEKVHISFYNGDELVYDTEVTLLGPAPSAGEGAEP